MKAIIFALVIIILASCQKYEQNNLILEHVASQKYDPSPNVRVPGGQWSKVSGPNVQVPGGWRDSFNFASNGVYKFRYRMDPSNSDTFTVIWLSH